MIPMRRVIVESPYRASEFYGIEHHLAYLKAAMADCIRRGESPIASHHLIPGAVLNDDTPYERALGIRCGLAWGEVADAVVIYSDFGVSPGMQEAIAVYKQIGKPIEWRGLSNKLIAEIREMPSTRNI